MSDLSNFFLGSSSTVVQLELLEFSHASFSKTYRIVRNAIDGITVTLEDLSSQTFEYYPLRITMGDSKDDLDQEIKVEFGDLGQVLPQELDLVAGGASGFSVKPTMKYRTYRSDILTAPLFGPLTLEVQKFSFNRTGAILEARAPTLNLNRTGELYTLNRFSSLRGCL